MQSSQPRAVEATEIQRSGGSVLGSHIILISLLTAPPSIRQFHQTCPEQGGPCVRTESWMRSLRDCLSSGHFTYQLHKGAIHFTTL